MERVVGGILGAVTGLAFTTLGLVNARGAGLRFEGGGNENTVAVIIAGVVIGALIGAVALRRRPFVIVGLLVGLAIGIWLRDNLDQPNVQPPWVFLLLFGLPLLGAFVGYYIHRRSSYAGKSSRQVSPEGPTSRS